LHALTTDCGTRIKQRALCVKPKATCHIIWQARINACTLVHYPI